MHSLDLFPQLLSRIHENRTALETAILELSALAERNRSRETAANVRGAMAIMDMNEEFKIALATLASPD